MCYLNFACRRSSRLSVYKIYTAVNNMCYVFVIYFLQPTNCNLTAILFSLAKHATKVLSKLVAASISVSCSCTICLQSRSRCLLQITQYRESAVYVLLAETDTTLKDAGAVKSHHCLITWIWWLNQGEPTWVLLSEGTLVNWVYQQGKVNDGSRIRNAPTMQSLLDRYEVRQK